MDAGIVEYIEMSNVHDRIPFPGRKYVTLLYEWAWMWHTDSTVYRILMWKIFEFE